jgi:hypothetical protein
MAIALGAVGCSGCVCCDASGLSERHRDPSRPRLHITVRRGGVILALLTAASEYIENLGIWIQLALFPSRGAFVGFFSVVTDLKTGLAYTCLAVLVVLMVMAAVFHQQRRRSPQASSAT